MRLERVYQSVLDNMNEKVYVRDLEMNLLYVNPAAEKLTGWSFKEAEGKKCYEVFGDEDRRCREVCPVDRAISQKLHILHHEGQLKTRSGSVCDMRVSISPLYENGTIFGAVVVMEDISWLREVEQTNVKTLIALEKEVEAHKRTEQELRQNKLFLESVFDAIQDGITVRDLDLNLVRVNRWIEKNFASEMPLIGKKCYKAFQKRKTPCPWCPAINAMKTGKPERALAPYSLGGEPIGWLELSAFPLLDTKGTVIGCIEHVKDVTERKRAEEEREKLQTRFQQAQKIQAIGTLAGGIAHDFNNLMMVINGNASLMLYDLDPTHPHYELLQEIIRQIRSGAKLTTQLLGYARKGRYEVKPINLNQLVGEVSGTFGRTHKEIRIRHELAEDLFGIKADRSQIEQVLLNLYINAAEAMPTGGILTLKTANVLHTDIKDIVHGPKPGSYVQLTVTDTGTGMDKQTQRRIFEPFFTTKEMGRGTGLGLASVYGIIKGHGGYINLDSEKGLGTTFSVYLPASDKKVEAVTKPAKQIAKGSGTILLVDDESAVLTVGVKMIEALGYTVLGAKGGKEAVAIYEANKDTIDLIVLDMTMPDVGGGETYDRMKEINPEVKVLLSSGYSIDGQAAAILERGCDGFIQKPFELEELSVKVKELLDKG